MKKSFLLLAVAMLALCLPSAVMAADNADFNITARLGIPITLTLDTDTIAFGTLTEAGGSHLDIPALNDIEVTLVGDPNVPYDVFFDGNLTAASTDYVVVMTDGAQNFNVEVQHDSGGALDASGDDTFSITAEIPGNALSALSSGVFAPTSLVNVRVDYQ